MMQIEGVVQHEGGLVNVLATRVALLEQQGKNKQRTFAWITRFRRLAHDYEGLTTRALAFRRDSRDPTHAFAVVSFQVLACHLRTVSEYGVSKPLVCCDSWHVGENSYQKSW
jgi:hypothetical protein